MLQPRIIPCLLIHNNGLVKTVQFKNPKYVGDPINAVRIFNEKEVDELFVVDIDASSNGVEPNYSLIEKLAYECTMPLSYGGGIKTPDQARKIFGLGVEKIALSSSVVDNPSLVTEIADSVGNQSVVIVLDVKKKIFGGYEIITLNAKKKTGLDPVSFVKYVENLGAGEIVLNSIDNDGMMSGYDLTLIDEIRRSTSLPLTVLGGAGSLEDIGGVISKHGIIGAAAGSMFVFKGKYRAVLINYPTPTEKKALLAKYFKPKWNDVEYK